MITKVSCKSSFDNATKTYDCPRCSTTNTIQYNKKAFQNSIEFENKPLLATCKKCRKTSLLMS